MSARRIGVLGAGKQTRKNAVALLKDFINNEPAEIFIVATPTFDDSARFAADFGLQTGIPVTIITDDEVDLTDYEDARIVVAEDSLESLIKGLAKADGSALLYCFEETDEEEVLLKDFLTAGVEVFDFADGLYPVTLEETPDEPEEVTDREAATAATPADDDPGLEPDTTDDGFVAEEPDEAQQPTPAPAKKPRAKKEPEPKAEPVATHTEECPVAAGSLPPLGTTEAERYLNSPQVQELIALGRAVKVLLDYIKAA